MDIPGLNAFGPKSPSQRDGKIYFNVKELMYLKIDMCMYAFEY